MIALRSRRCGLLARLRRDQSGLALIEFAYSLPIFVGLGMTGMELSNYALTLQRVNQMATELADNASRMNENSTLSTIPIYEANIDDIFVGANLQSGTLNLYANGRVILTQLQTGTDSNGNTIQVAGWQRCYGQQTGYTAQYSVNSSKGIVNKSGTSVIAAPTNGQTMFSEVHYKYTPLFTIAYNTVFRKIQPIRLATNLAATAAFIVRDKRDTSQVYQTTPPATVYGC